jgi:hypothetical protein
LGKSFSEAGPVFGLAMISTGATPSIATCVNCVIGSYGSLGTVHGPIDSGVEFDSISVYPSGAARVTSAPPMVPPAPGLLSTITGWPIALASGSEIARATMSLAPPAANVTTMRTGFSGQAAWAVAAAAHSSAAMRLNKRCEFKLGS